MSVTFEPTFLLSMVVILHITVSMVIGIFGMLFVICAKECVFPNLWETVTIVLVACVLLYIGIMDLIRLLLPLL